MAHSEEADNLTALQNLIGLYPHTTASYYVKYNWARSIIDEDFRKKRVAAITVCTAKRLATDEDFRKARNAKQAQRSKERYHNDEEFRERRKAISAASRAAKKSCSPLALD
jgi:hypothetical protein